MAGTKDLNLGKNSGKPDATSKAGGKRKWLLLLAVVALVLGGGGTAFFFLSGAADTATADASVAGNPAAELREPIYLPMEKFLVNFDHKGSMRYLQTDIQLMAYDAKAVERAKRNMPAVRNHLIMLFSDQDFDALRTVEGKEALRKAVLDAVNGTLNVTGPNAVQEAYFTSFVLQ